MVTEKEIQNRIEAIELRNKEVELNKDWEQSYTRKFLIVLFTFLSIATYMWVICVENPLLNAIIPALGFTLSTLSLPYFKKWWINRCSR